MSEWIKSAEALENLGIIGVLSLFLVIAGLVIRYLHKKSEGDVKNQLELTEKVGDLKGDVKSLETRLEVTAQVEEKIREEHRSEMKLLHRSVLEVVAGVVKAK